MNRARIAGLCLLAATLSGCGGGPASSGSEPIPPQLGVLTSSPAASSSGINPDSGTVSVTLWAHGYPRPSSGYTLSCGADVVASSSSSLVGDWTASTEEFVVRTPYDKLPGNSNCEFAGTLAADAPGGGSARTMAWSIKFSTAAAQPLRYPTTVVGILGGRMFALGVTPPYTLRREAAIAVGPQERPAPTPWLLGTTLTPAGLVPVALQGHSAGGPVAVQGRFNPATAHSSSALSTDAFPAQHEYSGSGPFTVGAGWLQEAGGAGPAPTATAKYWASDANGGWFYVEAADLETLLHRDATGAPTVVFREAGATFGPLRSFSK